jgi:hypothetical protein
LLKGSPEREGGRSFLASAISRSDTHRIFLQRFVKIEAYLQPVSIKIDKLKDRVGKVAVKTEQHLL